MYNLYKNSSCILWAKPPQLLPGSYRPVRRSLGSQIHLHKTLRSLNESIDPIFGISNNEFEEIVQKSFPKFKTMSTEV